MFCVPSISGLFKWRQFEPEVILLAVGWYLRFCVAMGPAFNNLGVEGRVLVRYVRVEQDARFRAVTKVNLPGFFAATAGLKALTVRGGSGALTPMTGERLPVLMVNERG